MGYNWASDRDICDIFAPIGGFRGWAIECSRTNFAPTILCCHGNEIWDKMSYNSASARDIFKIFAANGRFCGAAIESGQTNSTTTDTCCHLNVTWLQMVKIVIVKYLWLVISITDQLTGKRYFTNKKANINVQNISQPVWCEQYHFL